MPRNAEPGSGRQCETPLLIGPRQESESPSQKNGGDFKAQNQVARCCARDFPSDPLSNLLTKPGATNN